MKNCIHTLKLGLWVEFFVNLMVVIIIDIHQLNLRPFGSLKSLVENSLYIYINLKEKYFMYFKKTNTK
jgi:hypothetical protein